MEKAQDNNSLHRGIGVYRFSQMKSIVEDVVRPESSSTKPALAGNGRLEVNSSKPAGDKSGTEVEAPSGAPTSGRPRQKPKTDTVVIPNAGRMISVRLGERPSAPKDRIAEYRQLLSTKSKDELIDILLNHDKHGPEHEVTEKIARIPVDEPSGEAAGSMQIPQNLSYLRLPTIRKTPIQQATPAWRIVLISLDQSSKPLGLVIDEEITVGRAAGDAAPDLDLTPFGAKNKGISRLHAKIRPYMNHLALIDNDSSNGTFWNRLRIPTNTEQPINEGDVIAFGRANFLVKIVKAPDAREPRTLI